MAQKKLQRAPAEQEYAAELDKLRRTDKDPVPPGWTMSPIAVERFVVGDESLGIARKFVAEPGVVRRVVISLCTSRGSLLIGEPGTAKSWLSELLAAAISADSTLTIQGGAISRPEQMLYEWNNTLRERLGPVPEALVPGPMYRGMREGKLVRFEEISRCPQPLQDAILSLLSDRMFVVPEMGEKGALFAAEGFNVVATSNSVDEGVKKMSAALKRRLNFETIHPIRHLDDETGVVKREVERLNRHAGFDVAPSPEIMEVLVTIFHELRSGQSLDGRSTYRMAGAAMSTAEAVNVAHALSVHGWYYNHGKMDMKSLLHFIIGSALKDNPDDRRRLRHYFDTEVSRKKGKHWREAFEQRILI